MCQICGKDGLLAMCINCQAYDEYDAGIIIYDARKETHALNVIKKLIVGKKFTFTNLYKYVNTVHMRNEIIKYDPEPRYCLALRRDSDAMLRLWRDFVSGET
jgi:hypothetical protein